MHGSSSRLTWGLGQISCLAVKHGVFRYIRMLIHERIHLSFAYSVQVLHLILSWSSFLSWLVFVGDLVLIGFLALHAYRDGKYRLNQG